MSYISSNNNRFYVAVEQTYGNAAAIAASNRIPAVKLIAKQQTDKIQRKDKTGSRTFLGNPSGLRKQTSFQLSTYMETWGDQTVTPPHDPLFQACFGGAAMQSNGGTVATWTAPSAIAFTAPHGLAPGQAVCSGGEIRFVSAVVDGHNSSAECAIYLTARVQFPDQSDSYLPARHEFAEHYDFRLLEPVHSGATRYSRRRGKYTYNQGKWRFSRV